MIFLSTTDYPSGQIIEFNIESAKHKKNKDIKAINDELIFLEELSFGEVHKRKDNGELWYINPSNTMARFITDVQLELFHKWDKQTLLQTEQEFEMLKEIGGLPSSQYSLYPDNLQFPGAITTNG